MVGSEHEVREDLPVAGQAAAAAGVVEAGALVLAAAAVVLAADPDLGLARRFDDLLGEEIALLELLDLHALASCGKVG